MLTPSLSVVIIEHEPGEQRLEEARAAAVAQPDAGQVERAQLDCRARACRCSRIAAALGAGARVDRRRDGDRLVLGEQRADHRREAVDEHARLLAVLDLAPRLPEVDVLVAPRCR